MSFLKPIHLVCLQFTTCELGVLGDEILYPFCYQKKYSAFPLLKDLLIKGSSSTGLSILAFYPEKYKHPVSSFVFIMSSTSKKHQSFVSEPMGNKLVTDLAGVGNVLGNRLSNAGYSKANSVLGKYLVQDQNPASFKGWMNDTCGANSKQSSDCYKCLNEWSKEFL